MPSIFRSRSEKFYRAKVGYVFAPDGKRARREFRLGDEPVVATKKAVVLAEKWLKEEQRRQRMLVMDRDTFPGDMLSHGPVWTGKPEDIEVNLEAYFAIPPEDLPDDKLDLPDLPSVTLEQAREQTLGRIKTKARRTGIEPLAFNLNDTKTLVTKLLIALASHDDAFAAKVLDDLFPADDDGNFYWPHDDGWRD